MLAEAAGSNPAQSIKRNSRLDGNNAYDVLGVQKHTYTSAITFRHQDEFFDYISLKKYAKDTLIHYRTYFSKHLNGRRFNSPLDLQKYIQSKVAGTVNITKVARVYLNYCEKFDKLPLDLIYKYRQFLKIDRHQPDVYVPSNDEVSKNFWKIEHDKQLHIVYLVLLTSGIRYVECLDFLRNYEKSRFTEHGNHVSYPVAACRNTKTINNIWIPLFIYKKLHHLDSTYNALRTRYHTLGGRLTFKYLRKWQYNFLIYNKVPESVADFIQGRASKSISANHYLAKAQQASHWYNKVANKFEKVIAQNQR